MSLPAIAGERDAHQNGNNLRPVHSHGCSSPDVREDRLQPPAHDQSYHGGHRGGLDIRCAFKIEIGRRPRPLILFKSVEARGHLPSDWRDLLFAIWLYYRPRDAGASAYLALVWRSSGLRHRYGRRARALLALKLEATT